MYSSSEEIRGELETLRDKEIITERLVAIIDTMIEGLYKRYIQDRDFCIFEDYRQNCWMQFMRKYKKAKLDKNLFAWFSTIFLNELRRMHRKTGITLETGKFNFTLLSCSAFQAKSETVFSKIPTHSLVGDEPQL